MNLWHSNTSTKKDYQLSDPFPALRVSVFHTIFIRNQLTLIYSQTRGRKHTIIGNILNVILT